METENLNVCSNYNQATKGVEGLLSDMCLSDGNITAKTPKDSSCNCFYSDNLSFKKCDRSLSISPIKNKDSDVTSGSSTFQVYGVPEDGLDITAPKHTVPGYKLKTSEEKDDPMDFYSNNDNTHAISALNATMSILEPPPYLDERTVVYVMDGETCLAMPSGRGTFGQVFAAYFYNDFERKLPLAVKEFFGKSTDHRVILNEASILYHLEGTGFVPCCYGVTFAEIACEGNDISELAIIQDFIGEGVSLENIVLQRTKLRKKHWLSIASQMITGLGRIHFKSVIVNDIKMDNILLDFYDEEVKIYFIDFGSATYNKGISYSTLTENLEVYCHFAPEVKQGALTSEASDIYSLGWTFQQMACVSEVEELFVVADMLTQENPRDRISLSCARKVVDGQ